MKRRPSGVAKPWPRKPNSMAPWTAHRASRSAMRRSEEHTSELQSLRHLVCRLLLEKSHRAALRADPGALCNDGNLNNREGMQSVKLFFLNDGAPPEFSPLPPRDAFRI